MMRYLTRLYGYLSPLLSALGWLEEQGHSLGDIFLPELDTEQNFIGGDSYLINTLISL
tara:strand:+ start:4320 stop:4493 length:174 start_codon:yes stop_codon:yes gene_type:complete